MRPPAPRVMLVLVLSASRFAGLPPGPALPGAHTVVRVLDILRPRKARHGHEFGRRAPGATSERYADARFHQWRITTSGIVRLAGGGGGWGRSDPPLLKNRQNRARHLRRRRWSDERADVGGPRWWWAQRCCSSLGWREVDALLADAPSALCDHIDKNALT
jgi:hypothetical protein